MFHVKQNFILRDINIDLYIKFEYIILYKKEIIISVLNFLFMIILYEGIYLKWKKQ